MSKLSLTTKLSFSFGLLFGIAIVLFATLFRGTESSYIARIAGEPAEEETIEQVVASPIIQEVTLSAAGAYTIGGQELYSFRADKRWPIASITKLMTALVADRLYLSEKPYEIIEITEEAVATEGDSGNLAAHELVRADDLIKAMMLVSSNDAAAALAEHYGEEAFVAEMNKTAVELGMTGTTFVDPTGLSVQNLSTVEDVRRLTKFIWDNYTYIFNISQRPRDTIIDRSDGSTWSLENINSFAGRSDFLGGKTGSIPEAEGNLVSIFSVPERNDEIIIIVLGTENRFLETEKILSDL